LVCTDNEFMHEIHRRWVFWTVCAIKQ